MQIKVNQNEKKNIIGLFFMAAILALYFQVTTHDFINYDDNIYITQNENIKGGFTSKSVAWAFRTTHAANWHPMTWLSHMLDIQLFGLNPTGHHLTNIFFHIANVVLLFTILNRMTGAIWQSAFVAALFAFHPLNVESVAWVAERKNLISTFFWLLTIWAYIGYSKNPDISRYLLAILFFILGLMSKPMLVTLPFVFLMFDFWPLKRMSSKLSHIILEKIPFLIFAIASCVITFFAQKSGGALHSIEGLPFSARITNALFSYIDYLGKTFWPKNLAVFYPHPGENISIWLGILSALILMGISIISLKLIRKAPYLAIGWFWYLGTLVPVIGIVQVGSQAMADRYTYVPLIGIFIIIAWGAPDLIKTNPLRKIIFSISIIVTISMLICVTWVQISYWKNNFNLLMHSLEVIDKTNPRTSYIYYNLANALVKQKNINEAISYYVNAIKLKPNEPVMYNNLGIAFSLTGDFREATKHFQKAIKLDPNYTRAYYNLGNVFGKQGKYKTAIKYFETAVKIGPDFALANNSLTSTRILLNETTLSEPQSE